MKNLSQLLVSITILISAAVKAETCEETDVVINSIRPVSGDYPSEKHKNTVELHHEVRSYCSLSACADSNKYRVVIDGSDTHMISAAYMAFAAGKKVNIFIDSGLGTRNGICVASYITVKK